MPPEGFRRPGADRADYQEAETIMSNPTQPQGTPGQYPNGMPPIVINNTAIAAASAGPGKKTNHVMHAVLTLCTGGLWIPVWIVTARRNARAGHISIRH